MSTDGVTSLRERNAELRHEVQTLRGFMDTLQTLAEALDQPPDDGEVMTALAHRLEGVVAVLDVQYAELLVLEEERDELVAVLAHGDAHFDAWRSQPAGAGMAGWVLHHGEALIANDAGADERFDAAVDQPAGLTAESILVVPVEGRNRALGVLRLFNRRSGMFDEDAQTLLSLTGRFAGELLAAVAERHESPDPAN